MKRAILLAAAVALALTLTPAAAGAGAAGDTGMVTIVHDATYSTDDPFPVTLCLDGEPYAGGEGQDPFVWGDVLGPVELPTGTYEASIFIGAVVTCDEGAPVIGPDDLEVTPGADITVAAIWPTDGPQFAVWPNDSLCYEPETSTRLTVRHGATTGGPVDVVATVDGTETTIISGLVEGGQETLDLPGGITAENVNVVPPGGGAPIISLGDVTLDAGTHYVVYAGGGNDGAAGAFIDPTAMDPCPVETTTTTVAPTTTTAPAAVVAQPTFTG